MKTILSNSTRKLLWFEISKLLIALSEKKYCVVCYNFRHTFVPYCSTWITKAIGKIIC